MSAFGKFMKLMSMAGGVRAKKHPITGSLAISAAGSTPVIPAAEVPYQLPPQKVRITAAQGVVGKSCGLTSINCIVGSSIALTIYDNATIAAGTVLFSQTMSAGDEVRIPGRSVGINGIFASFTGTATFDVGVSDVS